MKETAIIASLLLLTSFVSPQHPPKTPASVIYHSQDGGKSWKPFDNGIPQDATASAFLVLADRVLATTDYHGIYSIKEGESKWKRIDEDLPEKVDINAITSLGNSLIIGTLRHGVMFSDTNGKSWSSPASQTKISAVRGLHAIGNTLLAGADEGIYRSMDRGKTWNHVFKGVQVNGFTQKNDILYAALMNGAAMSVDKGVTWKYVYQPRTLHDISTDGERIYAMTLGGGLKKSNNNGQTWEDANNGMGTVNLYTFEVKRFNNKLFAAQWYGIYQSEDWGTSWSLIKNGLPDSTAFTTLEATRSGLISGIGLRKK